MSETVDSDSKVSETTPENLEKAAETLPDSSEKEVKSTAENTEKKLSEDAFQHFIQGKRHMLVQDFTEAVASLANACQLYVEHFGETAIECGEVYFYYGKALFRLFQQQAGIIGNLGDDGSSNDEDQKDSESEEEKTKENADTTSNDDDDNENAEDDDQNDDDEEENDEEDIADDDEENSKDADESATKDATDSKTEDVPKPSEQSMVEEKANDKIETDNKIPPDEAAVVASGDTKPDESSSSSTQNVVDPELEKPGPSRPKTEEDVTDLQLAWETLETAKSIFKRQGDDNQEGQLKVAEILLIVAEISMELENYNAAVADLEECLLIRKQYLPSDDRLLAETFYQFGLLYTLNSHVSLALENYQKSIDCIQLRISNLQGRTEVLKSPEGWDILPHEEIKELEAILPDIIGKMEDTKDMVQDTKKLLMKELSISSSEAAPNSSSDKPVTNITHLLKRKKPEDVASSSSSESKKIKLTNTSNGEEQMQAGSSSTSSLPVEGVTNT